jgi:hypothetical protein
MGARDLSGAAEICTHLRALYPDSNGVGSLFGEIQFAECEDAAAQRFPGPHYLQWLEWFHGALKPKTYLEIGVESGRSMNFSRAPTKGVGVDPAFEIVHPQEIWVKFFRLPSDDFFARHNLHQVLDAPVLDLAFIDGLHTFDQALRDFMNAERYAAPSSVILFHDIFPVTPVTAMRERESHFWIGDTWKVLLILKKFRPDLNIFTIPTYPSGLGVVTGLNPDSTILQRDFDAICAEAMNYQLDTYLPQIDDHLNVVKNEFGVVAARLNVTASS